MNRVNFQLTLREWWTQITSPLTYLMAGGISLILALIGPFGTIDSLSLLESLSYWTAMVFTTNAIGALSGQIASQALTANLWGRIAFSGFLTGIGCSVFIIALNAVVFSWIPSALELARLIPTIFAISLIVTTVLILTLEKFAHHPPSQSPPPSAKIAPLLKRLPLDKRGTLIALSVEDHYVRVATTKGETMVLMRLSDAILEASQVRGDQVHRSHWVAFDQVINAIKQGDRVTLTMSDNRSIPVSRSNLPKIKEAGLLPK